MPQEWDEKGNPIKAPTEWDEKGNPIGVKPTEAQQVQQGLPGIPRPQVNMQPSPLGGAHPTAQQEAGINAALPQVPGIISDIRKTALTAGLGGAGGKLIEGAGAVPAIGRSVASGLGAIGGNVLGSVISGQTPNSNEAGQAGAAFAGSNIVGEAVSPFVKWLTSSRTVGAKMLQQASSRAGSAPIELSPRTNEIVDDLVQRQKLGDKPIKVVSDLLERVGPSTKQDAFAKPGPLTYDEARILQSNMSKMTAEGPMSGAQSGLLKQLASSFSKDVQAGATRAGIGPEHAIGMTEYAQASGRNRALAKAVKVGAAGVGLYGAEQVAKKSLQGILK